MTALVDELKVRARVRLSAARREGAAPDLKLRDCLHDAARAVGFVRWEHARRVLGGEALPGGGLWRRGVAVAGDAAAARISNHL